MKSETLFAINMQVYNLGESEDSKNWLKENNKSVGALFLSHVTKVCHFLAEQKPGIKPIFWEDMLRKLDANLIKGMPFKDSQHYSTANLITIILNIFFNRPYTNIET